MLAWLWRWLWGDNSVAGGNSDGLREVITLLGFLLAWQAALLVYVQTHPSVKLSVVIIYILVSLLPLVGMFSICAEPEIKAHQRKIGWRLSVIGLIVVSCLAASYLKKVLPGQIETGTFLDTGTNYVAVNLERDVSRVVTATWHAKLSERAAKYWRIEQVLCFRDKERTDRISPFAADSSKSTQVSVVGYFSSQLSHTYYFLVVLEQISTELPNFKFSKEDDLFFDIAPEDE